jgi:hypothetical protein
MGAGLVYPYTPPDGSVPGYRVGLHKRKTLSNIGTKLINASSQFDLEIALDISPFFQRAGDVLLIHSCSIELQAGTPGPPPVGDFTGSLAISNLAIALRDKTTGQNLSWWPTFLLNFFGTFQFSKVPNCGIYYNFGLPILRWDDFTELVMNGNSTAQGLANAQLVVQAVASNGDGGAAHSFWGQFILLFDTQNLNLTGGVRQGV